MIKARVTESNAKNKRAKAELLEDGKVIKTINFGSKDAYSYFDGAGEQKRKSYIARHRVNEDWSDPKTAGFWARWVLWERPRDIRKMLSKKGVKLEKLELDRNPPK